MRTSWALVPCVLWKITLEREPDTLKGTLALWYPTPPFCCQNNHLTCNHITSSLMQWCLTVRVRLRFGSRVTCTLKKSWAICSCLFFFRALLSNSSPDFSEKSFSLGSGCFFTISYQPISFTWPFSEKCFSSVRPFNTDPWNIQVQKNLPSLKW